MSIEIALSKREIKAKIDKVLEIYFSDMKNEGVVRPESIDTYAEQIKFMQKRMKKDFIKDFNKKIK